MCSRHRDQGLGGKEFRVMGLGCRVRSFGLWVLDVRFRIYGFRVLAFVV